MLRNIILCLAILASACLASGTWNDVTSYENNEDLEMILGLIECVPRDGKDKGKCLTCLHPEWPAGTSCA